MIIEQVIEYIKNEQKEYTDYEPAFFLVLEKIVKKLEHLSTQSNVVDRYFLVWPDWWIFSSDKREECIDFKLNMLESKRFAIWKIKSLIIVDIQALWKYN